MTKRLNWAAACVLAAVGAGAAPPPRPSDDPEPPKPVYHHYNLFITGEKRSPEEFRKLLAPLKVAHFDIMTPDDVMPDLIREGQIRRRYRVWIRTSDSYERVRRVIEGKPAVTRVWPPAILAKRTVDRMPKVSKVDVSRDEAPVRKPKR